MILRSVDLPAPLRPISATRSRGSIWTEADSTRGRCPKAIDTRSSATSGIPPKYYGALLSTSRMRILVLFLSLALVATMSAQPQLTLDHAAMARQIVTQLALKPGERVLSIAHPGTFADLMP